MRSFAIAMLVSVAVSGCTDDGPKPECTRDEHCEPGFQCVRGMCEPKPVPDAPENCGEFDFAVDPEPPDIVLIVDRSTSMNGEISGAGTKWEAMLSAVSSTTHALESRIHFGLASYAAEGAGLCGPGSVLINPDHENADAIVARLTDGGTGGATPTAATLRAVAAYLSILRPGHEEHPLAIVLATDGAPNCNQDLAGPCPCAVNVDEMCAGQECLDDAGAYAAVDELAGAAIPIYVVGLPGSEAFTGVLSEMARRGGTARAGDPAYYRADDAGALEGALTEIAASLVSCVFTLDVVPEHLRRVQIVIDGNEVPHTDDRSEGWAYASDDNKSFELFGTACELIKDGGQHTIRATLACYDVF